MSDLDTLVELSHEFGSPEFVLGGGGNSSVKSGETLWVKPSGTTLAGLTTETLIPMNRDKIEALYTHEMPGDVTEREACVKQLMAEAVQDGDGRPSVEAPLHNLFPAKFVMHTHPAVINGLTCSQNGANICQDLLPDALWVEYADPGYTLSILVRERLHQYRSERGVEATVVILDHHGLFVSGDSKEEIRARHQAVLEPLNDIYRSKGISLALTVQDSGEFDPQADFQKLFGEDAVGLASAGRFDYVSGPITPDHLMYAGAVPFCGTLSESDAKVYREENGYNPRIVVTDDRVVGLGTTQEKADLALELAMDAALVKQFAEAFGGVRYMTMEQREFIENWEVGTFHQQKVPE